MLHAHIVITHFVMINNVFPSFVSTFIQLCLVGNSNICPGHLRYTINVLEFQYLSWTFEIYN